MPKPNFFILGAPKCGTTSLAAWLGEHPSIFVSPTKEPKYFASDIPHRRFVTTPAQYAALFDGAGGEHRAIGEASTEYLFSKDAVPSILEYAPGARLVACLRNPVTLAPSLHEQMIFDGDEPILDFWTAWQAQFPERDPANIPKGPYHPAFYRYGPRCLLGEQVQRLLALAPREQVHFIFAEDLRNRTAETYAGLLEFLDVRHDGRSEFPTLNTAKKLRHPRIRHWLNRANAAKKRLGINVDTGIARKLTKWNKEERARQDLPEEHRRALEAYFRNDIALLSSLTDRDLSHWLNEPGLP